MKTQISNIQRMWHKLVAILFFSSFCAHADNSLTPKSAPEHTAKPIRVLFIGNSLVYQNDLPGMLRRLCETSNPPVAIETAQVTPGGCTLEKHWNDGKALAKIKEGIWDYVVLQEQSVTPIVNYEAMAKYARLFDAEIKKVNAKPLFYMTWALRDSPQDHAKLTDAYLKIAKELGADVVPVGYARAKAKEGDPSLDLFVKDGKHPSPTGTYLAACTFYIYLTGHPLKDAPCKITNPNNQEIVLVDLVPETATYLQKVAEETVLGMKK
jgi:hypothetical protein